MQITIQCRFSNYSSKKRRCFRRKQLKPPFTPQDSVVWYLQLGAGQINDIDSEIRMTVESILEDGAQNFIVLGESMLGERVTISDPRVKILRDYPNGIYFKAFNYSVQAGGYNSFHEMRRASIPRFSILI